MSAKKPPLPPPEALTWAKAAMRGRGEVQVYGDVYMVRWLDRKQRIIKPPRAGGTGTVNQNPPVNTVLPVITGTVELGATLTGSDGTWTGDPYGFTYQWKRNGALIPGAFLSTYVLVSADIGKTITFLVTATNAWGTRSALSDGVGTVLPVAPVNSALPAISGTATEGFTLSASTGTWSGSPTSYAYQWKRDGSNISGATSATRTLVTADVGAVITVAVTATNAGGSTTATSAGTSAVAAAGTPFPVNTVTPSITGTAQVSRTLTAARGTWSGSPTSYTYQWRRGGASIPGATGSTYVVTTGDIGSTITVAVTATNGSGSALAESAATSAVLPLAPAVLSPPAISGTPSLGATLTASTGTWANTPSGYAYQWKRNGVAIGGATSSTYVVVEADASQALTVTVTASNAGGSASSTSASVGGIPAPAPGLVGPHASWNGTAGSGATAPLDPTRSTAKPMASWWTPTLQRFTDDMLIGVVADAKGGILSVALSGDCATALSTTPTVRAYTDVNGAMKLTPPAYWFTLDHSAFVAVNGTTSKINLYATVTANDGSMQTRVIGGTNVYGGDNLVDGKQPQQHYPRTTQFTWEKTIGSGGDYASWDSCMAALLAAAPKAPHVTFITTGTYPSSGIDFGNQHTGTEGYCVVDAAPGVTATITRGTSFIATGGASTPNYWTRPWYFLPGCNQIKFTGAGVVMDVKNYTHLMQTNNYQPFWFDGCRLINSIGTLDTTYFNGAPHVGWGPMHLESNGVPAYFTDIYSEYVDPPYGAFCWTNVTGFKPGYGVHNKIRLNVGNYERGATPEFQLFGPDKLSGTYVGAATTARCKVYGYDSGAKVELYENGAVVKTVTFPNLKNTRSYQTAAQAGTTVNAEISALVTELNTRSGWTFTELNVSKGWFAWGFNNGGVSDQNCKSVTATWKCGIDAHTEFLQQADFLGGPGNTGNENFIIWNNVVREAYYSTSFFNDDTAQDVSIKFNVFDEGVLASGDSSQWGLGKHLLIENNFIHDGIKTTHAAGADAYSSFRLNILIGGPGKNDVSVWPSAPGYQDNFWVPGGDGQPAGSLDSGNLTAADAAAIYALFTDRDAGDYRPAGALLTNKKASRRATDGRGNALAGTDCIGPWADGFGAPAWPF